MYAFNGMNYDSAMNVPVVYRKWLLKRWTEQKEKENKINHKDVDEPLTQAEKIKASNQAKSINPHFPGAFK